MIPRIRIHILISLLVLSLSLPAPPVVQAEMWPPFHKLSRGLFNVMSGFLEVPKQAIRESRKGEEKDLGLTFIGFFSGLFLGTVYAVARTAVGAVEVATFPLPNLSGTYQPLMQPETVFSDGSWLDIPEQEDHQQEEPY